jgi:hypothetical protein
MKIIEGRDSETWYYRIYNDLPKIPQKFVDQAMLIAYNTLRVAPEKSNNGDYLPTANRPLTLPDGTETVSRRTPRWKISDEFEQWVQENISADFNDAGVSISEGDSDVTGPHTDGTRQYNLLYLIDQSNTDQHTCWWQEHGHSIIREERSLWIRDMRNLENKMCIEFPLNTWASMKIDILHSIHNIQGKRISIQISFNNDPYELF